MAAPIEDPPTALVSVKEGQEEQYYFFTLLPSVKEGLPFEEILRHADFECLKKLYLACWISKDLKIAAKKRYYFLTALASVNEGLPFKKIFCRLEYYRDLKSCFEACRWSKLLKDVIAAMKEYCFLKDLPHDFLIEEIFFRHLGYGDLNLLLMACSKTKELRDVVITAMKEYPYLKDLPHDVLIVEILGRLGFGDLEKLLMACLETNELRDLIITEMNCSLEVLPHDVREERLHIMRICLEELFEASLKKKKLRDSVSNARTMTP